jgi:multidrug efflux pump subunit AcrA (membrane-fusion protein)
MAKSTPRFRKELPAVATETDGVPCVQVNDPETGTSFTFYEFEYDLAHQLDGQDVQGVIAWAVANYKTDLTPEAIAEFASKLGELGFLERGGAGPRAESAGQDSAEVEWNATPGAATHQFVPDASMLSAGGAPGMPAIPADSAPTFMGFESAAGSALSDASGVTEISSGVTELPSDALTELAESGPVSLSGATSSSSGIPRAVGASASGATNPYASGALSRGFERRQPPGPDAVVMTPFEDVSRRFRAPPPERQRSSTGLIVTLVALVLVVVGGVYYYWMRVHPKLPEALRLRVVAPQPTAVYRWFATAGSVVDLDARTMSFETQGKVVELLPSGTKFAAGDTLGKLQGAGDLENEIAKHKSKLAALEQLRDSLKASDNKANLRDAEDKVTARQKMLADVQASLAKLILRAPEPGAIVETSAKVGALVAARAPVLKWRGRSLHGDFTMDQEDFAKASKLEFCRVEVAGLGATDTTPGAQTTAATTAPARAAGSGGAGGAAAAAGELRYVDCTLPPPAPPPVNGVPSLLRKFIVTLPNNAGLVTGQQLHLARKRFDGVFPLPLSAVQTTTEVDAKVWVAAPNGTAEQRNVIVAESRDEVLVARGLNVGDEIIIEPPRDPTPGTLVDPIR